jgi:hypothetical protein
VHWGYEATKDERISDQSGDEVEGHKDDEETKEVNGGESSGEQEVHCPVKLSMWYFDQCDPKKCSGMHLKR